MVLVAAVMLVALPWACSMDAAPIVCLSGSVSTRRAAPRANKPGDIPMWDLLKKMKGRADVQAQGSMAPAPHSPAYITKGDYIFDAPKPSG